MDTHSFTGASGDHGFFIRKQSQHGVALDCQSGRWKKGAGGGRLVDMEPCPHVQVLENGSTTKNITVGPYGLYRGLVAGNSGVVRGVSTHFPDGTRNTAISNSKERYGCFGASWILMYRPPEGNPNQPGA